MVVGVMVAVAVAVDVGWRLGVAVGVSAGPGVESSGRVVLPAGGVALAAGVLSAFPKGEGMIPSSIKSKTRITAITAVATPIPEQPEF